MIAQRNKILVMLIFAMLISNCDSSTTTGSSKEISFESLYPDCNMNSTIVFLPLQPNYKFENYITLSYRNTSKKQIAFPPDAEVGIFIYEKGNSKWAEVRNNIQYSSSPKPYVIIGSAGEMSNYGSIVIAPDISDDSSKEIRVAITGHVYRDGVVTDECVGAFINIQS